MVDKVSSVIKSENRVDLTFWIIGILLILLYLCEFILNPEVKSIAPIVFGIWVLPPFRRALMRFPAWLGVICYFVFGFAAGAFLFNILIPKLINVFGG